MTPSLVQRIGLVAVAALLPLTACAPGGGSSSGGEEVDSSDVQKDVSKAGDVTLTVWDQEVRSGQDKPLKELNAEFQEKYPNVTIKRVSRSFDDLQKQVRLAISSGDAPDVVQANNARADMGAFVKAGLLRPLDGYADAYGWGDRLSDDVRAVASYSKDGKTFGEGSLYGVPLTGEMVGVWFNKAKLEKLGLQPPTDLAGFQAALAKAKKAGEVPIQFGDLDQWPGIHTWGFVQNLNVPQADIVKLGFGQPGASWTSADNEKAATMLAGWASKGYFTKGFNGLGYDPSWQDFAKGEGVFLVSGTWLLADLEDGLGQDLGFMLPPMGASGKLAVTGSTGLPFAITSESEHPDVAAAYLDFISSKDAMAKISKAGGLPVYDVEAQSPSGTQAEMYDAWGQALEEQALTPYLDWATPEAGTVVPAEVQKLMGGDTSPADFLKKLEDDYSSFTG